jgi:hypothetical protein
MRAGNTEDNEQTLSRMSGDEGQKQGRGNNDTMSVSGTRVM